MPTVWIAQKPTYRDASGEYREKHDLSPAKEFGELRTVLNDDINPFRNMDVTLDEIRRATNDYKDGDYMLLVGNPVLISLVAISISEMADELKFLQWNRTRRCYGEVEVKL